MKGIKHRVISYMLGLIILSLGVSFTIKSEVGTGPWDALNVGLSKLMFTVGTWVVIVGIVLIAVNALLLKRKPDFYALITIFIVGFSIDMWLLLFKGFSPDSYLMSFLIFIVGLLLLSFGISVYLQAKFAPVPIDNLMIAIHKRFGLSMGISKTVAEIIAFIFALVFRGPVGIGTILVTVLIGPLIHLFYPRVEKFITRIT